MKGSTDLLMKDLFYIKYITILNRLKGRKIGELNFASWVYSIQATKYIMKANQHCSCIWVNALRVSWAGGTTWLRTGLLVLDSSKQIHSSHRSEAAGSDRVAGGWCSRYVWRIDSCTVKEHRSLHVPSRVLTESECSVHRHRSKGLAAARCCGAPTWLITVLENTAASEALVEGKSWGCWGSSSRHCVQSSRWTDWLVPEEQTPLSTIFRSSHINEKMQLKLSRSIWAKSQMQITVTFTQP